MALRAFIALSFVLLAGRPTALNVTGTWTGTPLHTAQSTLAR